METIRNEITLSAQGRLLKVSVCGGGINQSGGGKRSVVTTFSRASRLRLLQKMATVKARKLTGLFLTLTYGQSFPNPREAKRHLDNFMKRLSRQYENISGFWRFEFQQRGAPHFHMLLFGIPFIAKESIAEWWGEVVGAEHWDYSKSKPRYPFTRIEPIYNHRHASSYVAKYVAKVNGANGGFNVPAYLTAKGEFIHPQTQEVSPSIGRWWGVFNANNLPLADMVEIAANGIGRAAVDTLRRALAATRWRVDPESRCGFFLFEDNPYTWLDYFQELIEMEGVHCETLLAM